MAEKKDKTEPAMTRITANSREIAAKLAGFRGPESSMSEVIDWIMETYGRQELAKYMEEEMKKSKKKSS